MTIKELIAELNELIETEENITENSRIRDADDCDVFSVVETIRGDEVVIYF